MGVVGTRAVARIGGTKVRLIMRGETAVRDRQQVIGRTDGALALQQNHNAHRGTAPASSLNNQVAQLGHPVAH